MRYAVLLILLAISLVAQGQPDCNNGITRDVDVRCACVKDPGSEQCDMVRRGFYEPHDWTQFKLMKPGVGAMTQTGIRTATPAKQPARPRQARVVPLTHHDYLRFLQPNAQVAAGFDLEKAFQSPETMELLFGQSEGEDARARLFGAVKEIDHFWLSFAAPNDLVLLATGKFEQGAFAGLLYAQGIQPVFLGDAHAMMIGSEPSIQAALARLAKPAANNGWVTRRARELARDHDSWIVNEPPPGASEGAVCHAIRRFALAFRMTGEKAVDAEATADSEAGALKIAAWIDQMKSVVREKTGAGALDPLTVTREGATLRFAAKGDALLSGEAGKAAMNSDLGVELYSVITAGFPGAQKVVAADKLLAVRAGMKREEVLSLLGKPLSISGIQGLDTPRETWTYQTPFGRHRTLRLDDGVVAEAVR